MKHVPTLLLTGAVPGLLIGGVICENFAAIQEIVETVLRAVS
jgi:hypothetical protein